MTNPVVRLASDRSRATPRERQLPAILCITMEMLEKARSRDWETVIALESQRNALIADYFATPVSGHEIAAVADCIKKVLDADKQLIELGDNERHYLRGNLQKIHHGKHALKAYTA